MSRVFLAEEISLGRKVVIKVLPPELAATVDAERFRREIQFAAKLQHPYIEGESLKSRLERTGALPIHETEKILAAILSAIDCAHQHGIVHRDIKPANILLTGHHAVVTDFGVAKALSAATNPGARMTSEGIAIGTPAYMAPEQAAADPAVDHRADLYAVGAVAYEMLTGRPVFSSRSLHGVLAAHAIEMPEPVTKRRGSIPPGLANTVMRALEKNAADRPQSAAEMLTAVEGAMSGGPTDSRTTAKRGTWRGTFMAMTTAAVLLLLGSGSWYWYNRNQVHADPTSPTATPSLAVLPFENLGSPEDAYFADGMTDEISNRLGALAGLRVIGRQSARRYANSDKPVKQIGEELGATYLLTGTVRWDRSKNGQNVVRVSPQLLRASDGTHLWSDASEQELSGVFKIQSQVAERVARELQVRLRRGEIQHLLTTPTQSIAAYDEYLRGRRELGINKFARAIPFLTRAIAADPKFALALADLGIARTELYWYRIDVSAGNLIAARKAIDSALALDPDLPEAHLALGGFYYHAELNYDKALAEYAVAERLSPNNPGAVASKAYVERRQGKWDESLRDLRRAVALDPRNPGHKGGLAHTLQWMRQYNASDSMARQVLELDSTWTWAYEYLALNAMLRNGDADSANRVLHLAMQKIEPGDHWILEHFLWPVIIDSRLLSLLRATNPPINLAPKVGYYSSMGWLAVLKGDTVGMRSAADSIFAYDSLLVADRQLSDRYSNLASAYALKGHRLKAVENSRKALSIEAVARNEMNRVTSLMALGYTAAVVGDYDEAIQAFRQALSIPAPVSRAYLRVDPFLAPLRRDPRFQQLIAGT
jgi:TolB-like protein/cytochrome c-type biogenesis protein CcmH/NrfG